MSFYHEWIIIFICEKCGKDQHMWKNKGQTYVHKAKASFGLKIPLSHSPQIEDSEIESFKTEITETDFRLDSQCILIVAFQ